MEILLLARIAILVFFASALVGPNDSEASTTGSISYLYGEGYKTKDYDRHTYRVDILNVSKNHLLYARVDNSSFEHDNASPNIRLIGHYGQGLHLSAQHQGAFRTTISSLGAGYTYVGKNYFGFTDINLTNSNFDNEGYQVFSYLKYNISEKYYIDGYVDFLAYQNYSNTTLSQVSLMRKFGNLDVGLEQQFYLNKARIKDLDESVTQFKLKYNF